MNLSANAVNAARTPHLGHGRHRHHLRNRLRRPADRVIALPGRDSYSLIGSGGWPRCGDSSGLKIAGHGLSVEEVESAFDGVFSLEERRDGSFQMFAETQSGRRIWVIWRFDRVDDALPDVLDELDDAPIFVITAY